jgi:hypothetical protein
VCAQSCPRLTRSGRASAGSRHDRFRRAKMASGCPQLAGLGTSRRPAPRYSTSACADALTKRRRTPLATADEEVQAAGRMFWFT